MEELKADLKLIDAELPKGTCEIELVDSDLFHWEVALAGPIGSPYKGGTFRFQIWYPIDYPTKPPRLKCLTPVYHCNIDAKGTVCLDLADDLLRLKPSHDTEELSSTRISALCLVQALLSLFAAPVPEDGLVAEASKLYICDRQEYNRRAHEWTMKHAF
ncbi:UBE2D2 [Symbiodinium sp. CCMP2456]|nr:UBE2D2 [Symbiodinium sp. CCMP2456]